MLRFMLDTDTCIRLMRDRPEGMRTRLNEGRMALCVSTVSLMEMLYGAEQAERRAVRMNEIDHLTARVQVLAFDEEAAAHTAEIRAVLKKRGVGIGAYDVMIAGHARSRGLVVVTGNLREFERVDGLLYENWVGSRPQ